MVTKKYTGTMSLPLPVQKKGPVVLMPSVRIGGKSLRNLRLSRKLFMRLSEMGEKGITLHLLSNHQDVLAIQGERCREIAIDGTALSRTRRWAYLWIMTSMVTLVLSVGSPDVPSVMGVVAFPMLLGSTYFFAKARAMRTAATQLLGSIEGGWQIRSV